MLSVWGVALLLLSVGALAEMMEVLPARSPLALTSFQPYEQTWADYKATHGKTYEDVEEEKSRFNVFMYNVKYIEQHNAQYHNGTKSYFLGLNQFAAMTNQEFRQYNGFGRRHLKDRVPASPKAFNISYLSPSNVVLPKTVDWRKKGYVTPVKDQGHCGSCWSFSTTGSVEGQHFRKTGHLVSLSEQQLVDCSGKFGNLGCNGGLMDNSFNYIMAVGGLETEEGYPYKAKDEKCQFKRREVAASISRYVDVPSGDEDELLEAVATVGPISIAIDVPLSFMFYMGGVYNDPRCKKGEADLDHAVLVVGYGARGRDDYWLVKNSWGTTWGDHGYVMMSRNKDNQCGIATMASYPLV